jgi:hypothetical protein
MASRPWTTDEDTQLKAYFHQGLSAKRIGELLGRSKSAVINRSILTQASDDANTAVMRSTAKLREAMLDAFVAYANHRGISMNAAKLLLMGDSPRRQIPGTERVYRGQMAEREFARPIGEIIAPIVVEIMDRAKAA